MDAYNSQFRFYVRNAADTVRTAQSSNIGPDGTWHHLVAVCDQANGVLSLYIDGALNATGAIVPGEGLLGPLPVYSPVLTSIGSRMQNSSDGNFLNQLTYAVVDEVAIYNYALSSNQVAAHYSAAAGPTVSLTIRWSSGSLPLSWPQGTLLQASNINGSWTPVSGAAPPSYSVTPTATRMFYRVQVR